MMTASFVGQFTPAAHAQTLGNPQVEVEVEVIEETTPPTSIIEYGESEEYEVEIVPSVEQDSVATDEVEVIIEEDFTGTFACVEQPVPTTVFYSSEGALPVIHWVSHYFAQSGWDPLTRCRAVAGRFQNFYEAGILDYLTAGIVNGLPVVCVSSEVGGPCRGVLYTLKPGQNASAEIQQLFDLSYGYQVGALYESGSRIYIDFQQYLEGLAERNSELSQD
ncbi:MAG: COP23 domain-containing protein [Leptolyngbyaceae bacterium]|nr:COP23 domain-containing protein [Leptolyngbyaceae bacterium]